MRPTSLCSRRDVVVVASVSCIYGIGSPMDYAGMAVFVDKQKEMDRDEVIHELIDISTTATTTSRSAAPSACGATRWTCSTLRRPSHPHRVLGGRDRVHRRDRPGHGRGAGLATRRCPSGPRPTTLRRGRRWTRLSARFRTSCASASCSSGRSHGGPARLEMRVNYDFLEMLETVGILLGIENYSRHLDGRAPASRPTPSSTTSRRTSSASSTSPRHGAADPRHARGRPLP